MRVCALELVTDKEGDNGRGRITCMNVPLLNTPSLTQSSALSCSLSTLQNPPPPTTTLHPPGLNVALSLTCFGSFHLMGSPGRN